MISNTELKAKFQELKNALVNENNRVYFRGNSFYKIGNIRCLNDEVFTVIGEEGSGWLATYNPMSDNVVVDGIQEQEFMNISL